MKFKVKADFKDNMDVVFKDCGYHFHPKFEDSYIKRLSKISYYPRWHLYFKKNQGIYEFNLHLDQKKVSYNGHTAHSGDYDDENVKIEAKRILNIMKKHI